MVAVAMVGLGLGGIGGWQRRQESLRRAEDLRLSAMMLDKTLRDLLSPGEDIARTGFRDRLADGTPFRVQGHGPRRLVFIPAWNLFPADESTIRKATDDLRRRASQLHRLGLHYEEAARWPWRSIEPEGRSSRSPRVSQGRAGG